MNCAMKKDQRIGEKRERVSDELRDEEGPAHWRKAGTGFRMKCALDEQFRTNSRFYQIGTYAGCGASPDRRVEGGLFLREKRMLSMGFKPAPGLKPMVERGTWTCAGAAELCLPATNLSRCYAQARKTSRKLAARASSMKSEPDRKAADARSLRHLRAWALWGAARV